MALPLPRVVADVGPGGGLVTAMGGMNSLANDMILRQINAIKKQYAPITAQSEAASKLAYANLMGPQFLAKLMGNDSALANMSEDQKRNALSMLYRAGSGQGTGNAVMGAPQGMPSGVGQPSTNALSGWFANKLKGAFQPQQQNPLTQAIPQQDAQMGMPQGNPALNAIPGKRPKNGVTVEGQQWYDKDGNPVYAEDEVEETGQPPIEMELTQGQRPKTYAENTGEFKGIIEEGKELGKIRAASKKELDQDYQQALQLKQPIDLLGKIITNPKFQNLRNIPGFQKLQMNGKVNFGTPEEKELIGKFQAAARQVVSATVKGFGGRILASEIPLSESMKLSDNDSIEAMLGKEPVIKAFNEMTLQRSRVASKLMKEYHLDKGEALEQADKMVNGEAIRKQAEMELNPITEEDITHTAKEMGMTREQVIQRLRAEGRYNG